MNTFRTISLIGATMTTGLCAGVFLLYAHTIMPGLATFDDLTFDTSFAAIDRAIINPVFMASAFLGALVLTAAATVAHRGGAAFAVTALALALYLATVAITVAVQLPLNDAIKQAVAAGGFDPAAVREAFDASRWQNWNQLRVLTSVGAFGCLCWALVQHGRSS